VENTYLSSLFDGRFAAEPVGDDGAVFIDRDGELFSYVLRFLRHPRRFEPKDLGGLIEAQQRALYVEAEFYGLADVMLPCLRDPSQPFRACRDSKPESELKFNLSSEAQKQYEAQGEFRAVPPNKGKKTAPVGPSNCLEGVTVVISGILDSLEVADAKAYIERHGGEVAASVNGRTSYLLVGTDCDTLVYKNARAAGTLHGRGRPLCHGVCVQTGISTPRAGRYRTWAVAKRASAGQVGLRYSSGHARSVERDLCVSQAVGLQD
jgi:hypothetical protein